ncbi:MAG: hypothetical protein RBS88_03005 [Spongiibacteraceae bacterium]|nr:hypothetical protein [Spongiibacteraceae bacterium]
MARYAALAFVVLTLAACRAADTPAQSSPAELVRCEEPRPEFCTHQYLPVCAHRDTGIRCVTTPCPSAAQQTYGNACAACADPAVEGWRPGEC